MTATHETTPGAPCWVELITPDASASYPFYEALFDWSRTAPADELGGYVNFLREGDVVAGGCQNVDGRMGPDGWSVYLLVDDAARTAARAVEHGGSLLVEPMPLPHDLGTLVVVADPSGLAVCGWEPGVHHGIAGIDQPRGRPMWFEAYTRDFATSTAFLRDVFDWDLHVLSDTDEFRYAMHGEYAGAKAGVMDGSSWLPPDVPGHWSLYVGVDDTDETLVRAVELGGAIVQQAEDTPHGRLATVADPCGQQVKIAGPHVGDGVPAP